MTVLVPEVDTLAYSLSSDSQSSLDVGDNYSEYKENTQFALSLQSYA